MKNERETAYRALNQIINEKKYSNLVLKNLSENSAFITQLVYGTLRNYYLLEHVVGKYCAKRPDRQIAVLLDMACYEMLFMKCDNYAVVNETVQISKKLAAGHYVSLCNAVLRKIRKEDLQVEDIALKYSHPDWLYKLWKAHYGEDTAVKIMQEDQKEAKVCARINLLKCDEPTLLKDDKFSKGTVEGSFYYRGNILESDAFKNNQVIIQSESSMLAVKAMDIHDNMRLLDLCAAPGSKTIQMAMEMHNTGTVVANDLYDFRVRLIEENAKRYGCNNIHTLCHDGLGIDTLLEKQSFDRVLLDAPCSGLGTLKHKPEIRITTTDKDIDSVTELQKNLLDHAAMMVKPGGKLVYSTCTLNKKENEKQIEAFIRRNEHFKLLEMHTVFPFEMGSDGFFIASLEAL